MCRARLQIKKEEEELNRGFGQGGPPDAKKGRKGGKGPPRHGPQQTAVELDEDGQPIKRLTTIQIFGDSKAVEAAVRMIDEAVENKEQKQKQRQKEYDRKREQKHRERQLYHLRHARDYETLGLPLGASKIEVKKAFK